MSLKSMAMKMALAFAAAKGYQAYRQNGGMEGLKGMLAKGGTGATSGAGGGLGGMLSSLTSGSGGASGGLGGMLGQLTGGRTGGGGLLGGLAAMAGGTAMAGSDPQTMMDRAEAGPKDEATAAAMIRAIGQAVRADGQIDDAERAVLHDILGDAETEADRAAIDVALSEPIDADALARDVPVGSEAQVYAAALTAIDPDHPAERDFLDRFARALRLDAATLQQLHQTAGKPA